MPTAGQTLLQEFSTNEEVNLGAATGITAKAGGGAAGTALTKKWNEINTATGTNIDSVVLPTPVIGLSVYIFNNTVFSIRVWTSAGTAAQTIVAGACYKYVCTKTGQKWHYSVLSVQPQ